jgi:UrcA family protein
MNFATFTSNTAPLGRIAVLVGCLFAGAAGAAQAAVPADTAPSVVVRYGDLDLSTTEGVRALYQRISVAAREVCPYEDSKQLSLVALNHNCREAAIERAVASVHNTQLAALRSEHSKRG